LPEALGNTAGQTILATDWGIMGPLVTMSKARFPIYAISDLLTVDSLTADQQTLLANAIAAPSYIFVGHAEGSEVFAGVNTRLQTFAQQRGYRRTLLRSVYDRHGRPILEVFRFEPSSSTEYPATGRGQHAWAGMYLPNIPGRFPWSAR